MKRTQFYKLGTNYKEMEALEFESRSLWHQSSYSLPKTGKI